MQKIRDLNRLLGKRNGVLILLLCVSSICIGIASLSLTLLVKNFINLLFDHTAGVPAVWGSLGLFALSTLFACVFGYFTKKMIYQKSQELKERLLNHALWADLGKFSDPLDRWITNLTQDIRNLLGFLDEILPDFFETIFVTLIMLATAAYFDWKVLLFSVICSVVYGGTLLFGQKIQQCEQEVQSCGEAINSGLLEYKDGLPLVHLFSGMKRFSEAICRDFSQVRTVNVKKARLEAMVELLGYGSNMIREIGILLIAPLLEGFDLGTTMALLNITSYINGAMASFSYAFVNFQKTSVAVDRLSRAFQSAREEETEGRPYPLSQGLQAEELSFLYPSGQGIAKVSCQIPSHVILGICGPIGSGKSTFCKVLTGLYQEQSGTVQLDGRPLAKMDRRSSTAYVDQKSLLFSGTVLENVTAFSEQPDVSRAQAAAEQAGILPWISEQEKGWDTQLEAENLPMSGGQRQRLAIARALYQQADILVLDEPMAFLDAKGQQDFAALIRDLAQYRTIFIISHQLELFQPGDYLLEFSGGTAVQRVMS